jgi:hypothetical protein
MVQGVTFGRSLPRPAGDGQAIQQKRVGAQVFAVEGAQVSGHDQRSGAQVTWECNSGGGEGPF